MFCQPYEDAFKCSYWAIPLHNILKTQTSNMQNNEHISHIQNPWLNFWGKILSNARVPPFPITDSLKSWFPASFLSKGLMLPMAHPWWHGDTQKKASTKNHCQRNLHCEWPYLLCEWPKFSHSNQQNARNDSSVLEWFANICLAQGNKKTFGLWLDGTIHPIFPRQKTSRHRIEALVRQKGSCCCCVVVVLVVCCCCFLWLSFLLLLLQFFSLVITYPVSWTIIHITQSWEPKFHDHGDTDRLKMDSQQKHV